MHLLDSDGDVVVSNRLVVDGQGTYVLDPATGRITFTPVVGFVGQATAIGYRVRLSTTPSAGTGTRRTGPRC